MLRYPIALASLAAALATAAVLAQAPVVRTADPIKRGVALADFPRTITLADNVYTYEDFHAGPEKFTTTNLFVVTDAGVLVADGQGSPAETKALVDAIAKVTRQPIKYVVIASDHGDHTAGNVSFPTGVTYLVHPTSKAILDKAADAAAKAGREPGWTLPADAVLVPNRHSIQLGTEPIDILFLGRAHTGGDLAVSLPRRKMLFLSEIYLNRVFPAMRSAYPSEWITTLDRAEAIKPDIYIAGHGFTEQGPVSREEFRAYRQALAAVVAEATRLHKAGVPVEQAIKQANWGEYGSWTLAASQGPIAVRKVYEELNGQLK
jgi:cyclase